MDDMVTTSSVQTYADVSSLQQLRVQAQTHQQSAITEVAKQFESVFTQLMIKSMRQANSVFTDEDSVVSSDNVQFYQSMYDNQISLQLAKTSSVGLADIISQQLHYMTDAKNEKDTKKEIKRNLLLGAISKINSNVTVSSDQHFVSPVTVKNITNRVTPATISSNDNFNSPEEFISKVWDSAKKVSATLGIDPKILVAQAALETGWGSHIIRNAVGELSYNLFGIKADKSWDKSSVNASTIEFRNGSMQKENADFRSYNSFAESFADYANFLQSNPRYQSALSKTADPYQYTRELQKAGYATDPHYAEKIQTIIQNSALKDFK